jgi:uncharacterized membrane protein YkoI
MLNRRTLILGLGAALLLPSAGAQAAGKDKSDKGKKDNNRGGNGKAKGKGNVNGNAGGTAARGNVTASDEALKAVRSGKALPLRKIQAMIAPRYPGLLLEATLESRGPLLFYVLKMLSPQGRVFILTVNAATGMIAGG